MEKCPPEILESIFEQATWVDDGRTGCALSLVSRYIHNASQSARYQSVALCSLVKIVAFAEAICLKPPELRRVKHLFMDTMAKHDSFTGGVTGMRMKVSTIYSRMREQYKEEISHIDIMDPSNDAIAVVLYLVSPTLELAHVVYPFPRQSVFPVMMGPTPSLRELTICGPGPETLQFQTLSLPSLRRLHLSHCLSMPGRYTARQGRRSSTLNLINSVAPNLTHLRISGLRDNDSYRELDGVLETKIPIPSTLERILFQIHPSSQYRYDSQRLKGDILLRARRDLARRIGLFDFRSDIVGLDEQKSVWLDRIIGGEGCWLENDLIPVEPILMIEN